MTSYIIYNIRISTSNAGPSMRYSDHYWPPEVNDSVCHWLQSQWGPRIYIVTQPATYTRSERTVPLWYHNAQHIHNICMLNMLLCTIYTCIYIYLCGNTWSRKNKKTKPYHWYMYINIKLWTSYTIIMYEQTQVSVWQRQRHRPYVIIKYLIV